MRYPGHRYLICIYAAVMACLALGLQVPTETSAASPKTSGNRCKVYILLVDQLTWDDLLDSRYSALYRIFRQGAVALMNTRTGGVTNSINAAVTIGASSRGLGTANAGQAFDSSTFLRVVSDVSNSGELFEAAGMDHGQDQGASSGKASAIYRRRTGLQPRGQIVNLAIAEIQARNRSIPFTVVPGALGSTLREANIDVAYLGNGDTDTPQRHLTAAFMDKQGQIPKGSVDLPLAKDAVFPFGVRTDYDTLWDMTKRYSSSTDLVVLELSDLARLSTAQNLYSQAQVTVLRSLALSHIDRFVQRLTSWMDPGDFMVLLVPTPPSSQLRRGDSLTPLVLWRPNGTSGLLVSPSTRRPGLVTNLDVAPTLLNLYGVPAPDTMYGRLASVKAVNNPVERLLKMRDQIVATSLQRRSILKQLVYVNIGLYLAAIVFILFAELPRWVGWILGLMLPAAMGMPFALLVLPVLNRQSPGSASTWAILIASLVAGAAWAVGRHPVKLASVIALVTAGAILADTFTGNHLVMNSILGYDPMGGARFYGIGNEYMGVLVGAAITGISPLLDLYPRGRNWLRAMVVLFFTVTLATISLPIFGANVGGTITAAIGFAVAGILLFSGSIRPWQVAVLALLPAALVLLNIYIDTWLSQSQVSHLGQAAALVGRRGISEAYSIALRKMTMNLKLFRYSVWSKALLVALGVMGWFSYRPPKLMMRIKEKFPNLVHGFVGSTAAATAALIFNDSGVVAAALVLNFTASVILFLGILITLQERDTGENQ